jgi:hypothetical protein
MRATLASEGTDDGYARGEVLTRMYRFCANAGLLLAPPVP